MNVLQPGGLNPRNDAASINWDITQSMKTKKTDGWIRSYLHPIKSEGHTSVENSQAGCARSYLAFASWEGDAGKGTGGRLPSEL